MLKKRKQVLEIKIENEVGQHKVSAIRWNGSFIEIDYRCGTINLLPEMIISSILFLGSDLVQNGDNFQVNGLYTESDMRRCFERDRTYVTTVTNKNQSTCVSTKEQSFEDYINENFKNPL